MVVLMKTAIFNCRSNNGTNKPGYAVTLSFKTESGYEAALTTLHFETVPVSLLAADALTGATPISFKAP